MLASELSTPCVTRRQAIGAVAALAATALHGGATAQTPAAAKLAKDHVKGPLVFLDYDQAELDAAYDQNVYAANSRQVVNRYTTSSATMRKYVGNPKRFAYGPTEIEKLDVYTTNRPNAPINIFLHGGAWRSGTSMQYGFPAEMFVNAGAHYIAVDFISVGDAGGSLMPMAEQIRRAIAWVYKNAASFGGDPGRIYLSGHSSGAHLAAVALITDWQAQFDVPGDVIKGALCCSGMYDLKGPRLSARSSYVKFDDRMEQELSPQRYLEKIRTPVIVAHGTEETPEFKRQAKDFAAALSNAGKPVTFLLCEQYNHYEIIETMASPYGLLGRAVIEQMGLKG